MIKMGKTYYYSRRGGTATSALCTDRAEPPPRENVAECAEPHSQLVAEPPQGVVNVDKSFY